MSLTTILYVYIHIFTFHIIHKNKTHANETGVLVYFDIDVRTQTLSVSLIFVEHTTSSTFFSYHKYTRLSDRQMFRPFRKLLGILS